MRLLYEGIDRQNKTIRTLATEAHHKTKNSLQLLASLLRFQSIKASDENTKTALEDAWGRLEAINHVHQKLLSQNLQSDGLALTNNISLKEYLKAVLDGSFAVVDYNPIYPVYELHGDDVELSMEIGWNVGLIVNELATNFIKHVLAEGKKLKVIISNKENHLQIAVSDNGKGYDVNLSKASSFGMEMINIIVHDLKGTLDIKSDENGSRFMIKIPAKLEPHEA